jgi:hypothetical protein
MMHIFGCEDFHFKNVTIVHLPFQLLTINLFFFTSTIKVNSGFLASKMQKIYNSLN